MKEIKVHNARPIQKLLMIVIASIFIWFWILIHILSGFDSLTNELIMGAVILILLIITFVSYFILRKFADSLLIFNYNGIVRYKKEIKVLDIKWEQITGIGCWNYDPIPIGNFDWGPNFLGIDYLDENNQEQRLNISFSRKDARKLVYSGLNKKLEGILGEQPKNIEEMLEKKIEINIDQENDEAK